MEAAALLSGHHPHDARDSGSTHAVQQTEALPALQVTFDGFRVAASPLRKHPTHIDPRETRLDMELRLHHTMGFDKSHMGVHRKILCHCHVGVELDGG
jgi:hypothetical protein